MRNIRSGCLLFRLKPDPDSTFQKKKLARAFGEQDPNLSFFKIPDLGGFDQNTPALMSKYVSEGK